MVPEFDVDAPFGIWAQIEEARNRELDSRRAERHAQVRNQWQGTIGSLFTQMLESPRATESYLADEDPMVRCAALYLLSHHWERSSNTARHLERIAFSDPVTAVREAAVSYLGKYYAESSNTRIGRRLAALVHDDAEPPELRKAAYVALYVVRGTPFASYATALRFPEDINWEFVDSFFGEQSPRGFFDVAPPTTAGVRAVRRAFLAYRDGMRLFRQQKYHEAIELLEESLTEHPTNRAYCMRGCAYGNLGDLDAAIADFTRAIQLSPKQAIPYLERSKAYHRKGMKETAEADYAKAIEIGW